EVVRIFYSIEHDHQVTIDDRIEFLVLFLSAKGDDALMTAVSAGVSVEGLTRFKSDCDFSLAAKIDDLLDARSARSFRNQHVIEEPARGQRFLHGMNPNQNGHLYLNYPLHELWQLSFSRSATRFGSGKPPHLFLP